MELLIWYDLALPVCFMLQAQTCLLNHSLIVRHTCHWCAKISRLVPCSPDTCPRDVLADVLTPSAVSCHSAPSICSPCLRLPQKSVPVSLWPLHSALAKFKTGEDLVLAIYGLSGRKMWEFSFLNVSCPKWLQMCKEMEVFHFLRSLFSSTDLAFSLQSSHWLLHAFGESWISRF